MDAVDRAIEMKRELLARVEKLGDSLPPNSLDQLIDELGGPESVAEVRPNSSLSSWNFFTFYK